jgi:hypothetical protein
MPGPTLNYAPYEAAAVAAPSVKKVGRWTKVKRWFSAVFCCCLRNDTVIVENPKKVSDPFASLPVLDASDAESVAAAKGGMYKTQTGMVMWDPASGTPCPHLLTTQHPRTGEKTCCHCKAVV